MPLRLLFLVLALLVSCAAASAQTPTIGLPVAGGGASAYGTPSSHQPLTFLIRAQATSGNVGSGWRVTQGILVQERHLAMIQLAFLAGDPAVPDSIQADPSLRFTRGAWLEASGMFGQSFPVHDRLRFWVAAGVGYVVYNRPEGKAACTFCVFGDAPDHGWTVPAEIGATVRVARWLSLDVSGNAGFSRFDPALSGSLGLRLELPR